MNKLERNYWVLIFCCSGLIVYAGMLTDGLWIIWLLFIAVIVHIINVVYFSYHKHLKRNEH